MQLEELADYKAKIPAKWSKVGYLHDQEIKRLRNDFAVALIIDTIPRRLGIYASRGDLVADTKLGRKMANVALRALQWRKADDKWMHDWLKAKVNARKNDTAYKEAARRQWTVWYYDRITWLEQQIPVVACWAIKDGRRKEGNEMCSRLIGERDMMIEVWEKVAPDKWREPEDKNE